MRETKFVNFNLKYPAELYVNEELPGAATLFEWQEALERSDFAKFSSSYNVDKSSFIAAYTYRGGKTTEPDTCSTAFGNSRLSALQKLYVLVEILGLREHGESIARENQEAIELVIAKEIKKAMGK